MSIAIENKTMVVVFFLKEVERAFKSNLPLEKEKSLKTFKHSLTLKSSSK